ncbi:MAG: SDR family oxidoreductase [Candidatus Wallbacteria bacterium]|nr:SDR family oxidoreductase [Candidatus Wallbacteria bacterium]
MRILITGATGNLGTYLLRHFQGGQHQVVGWSLKTGRQLFGAAITPVDLADPKAVEKAFDAAAPDVVIHAAAMASVEACHRAPGQADAVNTTASGLLLTLSAGRRLVYVSTDLVFSGEKGGYRETDVAEPLSVYGRTKRAAEPAVTSCWFAQTVAIRLGLLYGPSMTDRLNFFDRTLAALRSGQPFALFHDEWRTPLSLRSAAAAVAGVATSNFLHFREIHHARLLHVAGPERLSRHEMGVRIATFLVADPWRLLRASRGDAVAPEPRPRDTSLDITRWRALFPGQTCPTLEEGLAGLGYSRLNWASGEKLPPPG